MATGTAIVDFGAGADHVVVTITGQAGILTTSRTEAWIDPTQGATADHTVDAHVMASALLSSPCSNIVNGAGFDINAVANCGKLVGKYNFAWAWV